MQTNRAQITVYYKRKIVSISVIEIHEDISQEAPQKYGVILTSDKRILCLLDRASSW